MKPWRQILSYRTPKEWVVGARVRLKKPYEYFGRIIPAGIEGTIVIVSTVFVAVVLDGPYPTPNSVSGNGNATGWNFQQDLCELI